MTVKIIDASPPPSRLVQDAKKLYDFALRKPKGFTRGDAEAKYGWEQTHFFAVVRQLRLILAEDDITLPCDPQGQGEHWLYFLSGTMDEVGPWEANRLADMESRFETMVAVVKPIAAKRGDSTERRKARKIERGLSYLVEELAELAEAV